MASREFTLTASYFRASLAGIQRVLIPPVSARRRRAIGPDSGDWMSISTSCCAVPSGKNTATVDHAPEPESEAFATLPVSGFPDELGSAAFTGTKTIPLGSESCTTSGALFAFDAAGGSPPDQ